MQAGARHWERAEPIVFFPSSPPSPSVTAVPSSSPSSPVSPSNASTGFLPPTSPASLSLHCPSHPPSSSSFAASISLPSSINHRAPLTLFHCRRRRSLLFPFSSFCGHPLPCFLFLSSPSQPPSSPPSSSSSPSSTTHHRSPFRLHRRQPCLSHRPLPCVPFSPSSTPVIPLPLPLHLLLRVGPCPSTVLLSATATSLFLHPSHRHPPLRLLHRLQTAAPPLLLCPDHHLPLPPSLFFSVNLHAPSFSAPPSPPLLFLLASSSSIGAGLHR